MSDMPFFSVIVPVYNVGAFLAKCIRSIMNQTCKDFEVIAVEDCSTDGSRQLLNKLSKEYHINVIELEENGGLGNARNIGMSKARGEYVVFVDSDDELEPTLLETLMSISQSSEIIIYNFYREWLSGKRRENMMTPVLEALSKRLILRDDFEKKRMLFSNSNVAWNKAYRRIFLLENSMVFDDGFYEDIFFNYKAIMLSKKIIVTPFFGYKYRQREYSILNHKSDRHKDLITQYKNLFSYLNQKDLNIYRSAVCEVFVRHVFNLLIKQHYRLTWRCEKEIISEVKKILHTNCLSKSCRPKSKVDKTKLAYLIYTNRLLNLFVSIMVARVAMHFQQFSKRGNQQN